MEDEAEKFIKRCDKCQRYVNNMHQPTELLYSIITPWSFMKWGMDIVGPLPQSPGKVRTTAKISTGETPFSLVYDTETLIPVEKGEPSTRFEHTNEALNEEKLRTNLVLTEERREETLIRMVSQKQRNERDYNRRVNLRQFKIGDFVLKKVFRSTQVANAGKLSPNWEGPYRFKGITGKGAYELETMDGKVLPSNWNVVRLKKYYF
ncbi:uncharacterized protein [Nicotiana tomentosiformis]|uniref:uncharacterized protein n=1 Tax=Nicotiana tomentosiformis TaxID=4098 RepID=UPI00388C62EC